MAGLNVTLGDGTVVTIKAGEKIEDIKTRLGGDVDNIFEGLDSNTNGVLDENELAGLKTKLAENDYQVELAPDGKTPKKAFNDAMQNMRKRYNNDTLKGYYMSGDADVWEIKRGDTLYDIAKETLEKEGLPTDFKSINDRIAQLANLNGINDVNNIRVGTKIIYKLTEEGVQKVKEAENNSAAAFGGTAPVNHGGGEGKNPVGGEGGSNPSGGVKPEGGEEAPPVLEGKESTITVTPNGLNMGAGQYIDKDGNVLPDLKGDNKKKFDEGGFIMKYTSGDKVMYQTVWKEDAGKLSSGVKLSAETPEALRELRTKFLETISKVKEAPADETEEAAAARKAENLAALKELVAISGGNIQVIKNVAEKLRDDNYVDRKSDAYKAFVQDILLTKNADALRALLYDADGNKKSAVLEYDKTAHEMVAGMYQEIRAKEKAGEMLSPEEIALKEVVANYRNKSGYTIEADEENGIHEKQMNYNNMDGTIKYTVFLENDVKFSAKDPALLDEFVTKLEAADTDEKKAALFKEYMNTTDTELARSLALNVKTLCAADEDIISLINANGMDVLDWLPMPEDDIEYSKEVVDAVVARMKEIYTTDKGNLENAVFLANLDWINKTDMSDEDKDKAKEEILETYFEVTTDEQGNKTYTFNPSRRPTYEEMNRLSQYTTSNMDLALLKYLKLEDMGKGQYSEAIENRVDNDDIRERYAEFVDGMQTKEEVIDFIDNKCSVLKNYILPFDKILEKFPDDEDIKKRLFKEVDSDSTISDANRIVLAKLCMKDDGKGNVTFDISKLNELYPNMPVWGFIDNVLPEECKDGDAKKYFEAALKELGKADLETIARYKNKNPDSVKARIGELVKENTSDNEFIQNVMKLDKSVIPFDVLTGIDAVQAKWDDKTKAAVFEGTFDNRVLFKDRAKHLEAAVNKHWITKVVTDEEGKDVVEDLYAIGDTLYKTRGWAYSGADKKMNTDDDRVSLKKLSKTGFDHGVAMFHELDGAGSGDIAKMLRGKKDEGYENYVTPDNITGILVGFNQMSPDEGIMEYIANERRISGGVKPGQALCNRIPKALMRKAAALGLQDTQAYKALADFFKPDEKFNFKQNDEAGERYDSDTAKQLDGLIAALLDEVLKKSGV